MADKIKGLVLKIGGDTSELANALKNINTKSRELQTDLKTVEKLLKLDPTNTVLLAQKQDLLAKSIDTTKEKLQALEKCENDVQKAFDNGTIDQTEFIEYEKQLVNAKNALEKLKDKQSETATKTDNLGKEANETGKKIEDMGEKSQTAGQVMKGSLAADAIVSSLKLIGNAVKDVSTATIQVGSDFEASMSQVAATMGMTKEEVRNGSEEYLKLKSSAEEMGAATKYTSAQAADALNYLALAGYDADKAVATLPKILTLAQAGGMEIATTSDLVTDAMGQLQMETDELDGFIDQMARTSQKSNTNVQQLGEALLVVGGTSVTTGQDIDKTNTALGILANNGLKGAEGGTKLRNILLSLSAPTDKAAEEIEKLGLNVSDADGNIRDIDEIMSDLNSTLSSMTEGEKTRVLSTIFNKRDISGVTALLDSTNGSFKELHENIVNSNGAATDMADTMNDNLKGRLAQVESALEAVGVAAYSKLQEPLKDAAEKSARKISDFAEEITDGELSGAFEDLGESVENFTDKGLELAEDALPLLIDGATFIMDNSDVIIGGLAGIAAAMITQKTVTIVTSAATAFTTLKKSIDAAKTAQQVYNAVSAATPWGAIATVVGLVVGGIATYALTADDAKDKTRYLTDEQKDLLEASQDLHSELENNRQTRQDNIEDIDAQYAGYEKMVDELYELNSAEELSAGKKAQIKNIVDELNTAIPELNIQLDEETGHLKTQKETIDKLIEANQELAKVSAAQEDLQEIGEEIYKAEKNADLLKENLDKTTKDYDEATKKYKNAYSGLVDYIVNSGAYTKEELDAMYSNPLDIENIAKDIASSSDEATEKVKKLSDEYWDNADKADKLKVETEELNEEYKKANKEVEKAQGEWDTTKKYIDKHSDALTESAETLETETGKMTVSVGKYKDQTVEVTTSAIEAIQTMEDEYHKQLDERKEELQDSLNVFEEFTLNTELSAQELLDNMQSNLNGVSDWADGLKELADRGLDEGLIQELRDAGPASASQVAAMTQMTDGQLAKYNSDWRKYLSEIEGIAEEEMSDVKTAIDNKISESVKSVEGQKENYKKSSKTAIGGIEEGIDEGLNIETIKTKIYEKLYGVGEYAGDGLKGGIWSKMPGVNAVVEQVAKGMLRASESELEINSPSKKFEKVGSYALEGEIVGWKKRTPDLLNQISETQQAIIDRANQYSELSTTIQATNISARGIYQQAFENSPNTNSYKSNREVSNDNMLSKPTFNITFGNVTINNDDDIEKLADKLMVVMSHKLNRREKAYGY